jgi:putative peptidoglycan lipid II flippase
VVINVALSLLLMGPMGVGGLALSTATASSVNAYVLYGMLRRKIGLLGGQRILRTTLKSLAGSLVMGVYCYAIMRTGWGPVAMRLLVAIAGGAAVYMGCARLFQMEEWAPFWAQISARRPTATVSD